jgi:hypothetical protein
MINFIKKYHESILALLALGLLSPMGSFLILL